MKDINRKRKKDKVAATLMLCFCLIALTSIFTIKSNINKISESAKDVPVTGETPTEKETPVADEKNTVAQEQESAPVNKKIPVVDSRGENTTVPEPAITYIYPIDNGQVDKPYAMDSLLYSNTLDQYMTHPGCDYSSKSTTSVKAIADGIVTDVYEDDKYGQTIEITHNNGVISLYANLAKDVLVEKGDTIKQGSVIGAAGNTALYEYGDGIHLHLEIIKDGVTKNPADYIPE